MNNFKLHDKIECVRVNCEALTKGKVYTVTGATEYWVLLSNDRGTEIWYDPTRFKLYEEKQMFNLKTDSWYIAPKNRTEYAATQEYLFTQGFGWYAENQEVSYAGQESYGETACIVHINGDGSDLGYSSICWATNSDNELKEIKLTFKTSVDAVEYPQIKTPAQIELEALQEKIQDLTKQAEKLQGMLNK